MNVRLRVAIAIVVLGAVTLVALRFISASPPTKTSAIATTSTTAIVATTAPPAVTPTSGGSSPTPLPAPSLAPKPNLLSAINGAFVRSWTVGGLQNNPQYLAQDYGSLDVTPSFNRPVSLLYELPTVAHLDRVGVALRGAQPARVAVAIGIDVHHLRDVGTVPIALPTDSGTERALTIAADARFVRFTITKTANVPLSVVAATAAGMPGAPQRGALSGFWLNLTPTATATQFGGMRGRVAETLPPLDRNDDERAAVEEDGRFTFFRCRDRYEPWQAALDAGRARAGAGVLQLAGNGNILVGNDGRQPILAFRAKALPACGSSAAVKGPVIATFVRVLGENAPEIDAAAVPRLRFEAHFSPLLAASQLQHASFAVLDGDCSASTDISPRRQRVLMDWVGAGHKLIIRDADMCSASDYTFLPFRFSTKATGAMGERGHVLAIADPSTLGATRSDAAHFLDVDAYLASKAQQIGDADLMQTDDPHWCGHLFATNALHANGWVQAYARYGRGLIIYDGFDRDDLKAAIPAARRLLEFEYAQSAQADLPCNARVASTLALYPSTDRALPAGKAVALHVPLQLVSTVKMTAPQDVNLSIEGDARFSARVTPARVRLPGGGAHELTATVSLPNGWSGSHAYAVTAIGPYGARAQATIFIDGSIALAKAFESQRRVRLYGIHFDVASATIQPVSEATIAQIAQVLAAHPDWTLRVEGYTDSDGGAAYNLDLSLRRAHSVVDDLVARYRVRRDHLHAAGLGLTKPDASNTTEAGRWRAPVLSIVKATRQATFSSEMESNASGQAGVSRFNVIAVMIELTRHASPVHGPQGLAWDGATMWLTSAANGRLYAIDPQTWSIQHEFVPPCESLGITYTGLDFQLIVAPSIDEPDLERDHRYVYTFSPDAGFAERFACPDNSGSFLAYANGTLYLSQAWAKKLIELDERGAAVREVQLERRPVGMTIVDGAFYLVTVDEEWGDGRFDRLGIDDDASSIQALRSLPFKPRSVAFDGEQFWTADRNNHAIVSFTLGDIASRA